MKGPGERDPWLRANELLDARLDPRVDDELARELDPEAQTELERLTRRLARLERAPRVATWPRVAAAALVLLAPLALMLWLYGGPGPLPADAIARIEPVRSDPGPDLGAPSDAGLEALTSPAPSGPAIARILEFRLTAETVRAGERRVTTTTSEGVEHRQESVHGKTHAVLAWTRR